MALVVGLIAASAGAATITGRVSDERGAAPPLVWVVALDPSDSTVLDTFQSADGSFALDVPDGNDVLLVALALSGRTVGGYELHEHTGAMTRLTGVAGAVRRDLKLRRAREYVLETRRPDGTLYREEELPPGSFPIDGEGEATAELLWAVDNGMTGARVPSLCVPLGEGRRLIFRLEVAGAGLLNLPLDLDGGGFTAEEQGGEVIDVNRELARTQLERLEGRIAELDAAGFQVPAEIQTRAAAARALFETVEGTAPPERAGTELEVVARAVLTLEDLELAHADRQALECRRGTLRVEVLGNDGAPVPGARITYRQISHDFLFGVFGPLVGTGQAVYDRMRRAGLNVVTAGYYWKDIEPARGQIDYPHIDHDVGVVDLADRGWRIKGHPLTWLYPFAMPDWLKTMGFPELKRASVDHVTMLIAHYRDRVHTWDVNNEAADYWATAGLSREQLDDYLRAVYAAARAADLSATLVLNSAFDWFGGNRLQERLDGRTSYVTLSVPAFIQRALDMGVDFDVIGQQMYNGGGVTLFHDAGLGPVEGTPSWDLGFLAHVLRRLSDYGKPIHITENSVSAAWDPQWAAVGAGYWHAPWSEAVQADFLEAFYRLCFGTPAVHAITWWDAVDDNPFMSHGALFHADGSPKPAFLRLESLIAGWTSSGELTTGGDGSGGFQGFAGDYELTVEEEGGTRTVTAHVFEGTAATRTIDLRKPRPTRRVLRVRPGG